MGSEMCIRDSFLIAENFLDSLLDDSVAGGGTAVLRMRCPQRVAEGSTPRAVGVPTGWSLTASGFPHMDNYIKTVIDLSLDRIAIVLDQHPQFKRLIYSCDEKAPNLLGVKIFKDTLHPKGQEGSSEQIHGIATRVASAPSTSILLTATTTGAPANFAHASESTVCSLQPSSAATTSTTMSVTFAPRSRISVKAAWPGVSMNVTALSLTGTT